MNQPFPTEDDPRQPYAPWDASPLGDDFDASKAHAADSHEARETEQTDETGESRETDERPPSFQPPEQGGEASFPWQSGSPNQKTTSSARLPWEMPEPPPSEQSYRTRTTPKTPPIPPPASSPKNSTQSKKLTSDLWQNITIPPWALAVAAMVAVLGIGVVWTANSLPKDSTTGGGQNTAIAGNNNPAGGGASGSTSVPVRPMRPRLSPGSSSKDAGKPGYVPEAAPSNPTNPSSGNETSSSAEAESPNKSPYLSSLEVSSSGTGAEGPTDPFSPAYPPPKPPPEPKPAAAPPPPKPQPVPPPPKVIPVVLSLEGVAVEGKTKLAIVRVGDQPLTAEAQVGATIEGWTVTAISDETVTLTKGKQRQVLRLP